MLSELQGSYEAFSPALLLDCPWKSIFVIRSPEHCLALQLVPQRARASAKGAIWFSVGTACASPLFISEVQPDKSIAFRCLLIVTLCLSFLDQTEGADALDSAELCSLKLLPWLKSLRRRSISTFTSSALNESWQSPGAHRAVA